MGNDSNGSEKTLDEKKGIREIRGEYKILQHCMGCKSGGSFLRQIETEKDLNEIIINEECALCHSKDIEQTLTKINNIHE